MPASPYHDTLSATIAEHGHAVIHVASDGLHPTMSYTVGLHADGHPELSIFGLTADVAQPILNLAAERMRFTGLRAGQRAFGLVAQMPVEVADATSWYSSLFTQAQLFHDDSGSGPADPPMLQLRWPDADGQHPWHGTALDTVHTVQPALERPLPYPAILHDNDRAVVAHRVTRGGTWQGLVELLPAEPTGQGLHRIAASPLGADDLHEGDVVAIADDDPLARDVDAPVVASVVEPSDRQTVRATNPTREPISDRPDIDGPAVGRSPYDFLVSATADGPRHRRELLDAFRAAGLEVAEL